MLPPPQGSAFSRLSKIWRCLFCILPTETVLAGYHVNFSGSGPDFGPRDLSQRLGNSRAMLVGRFSRPGDHSRPISDHFGDFGPDPHLRLQHLSCLNSRHLSCLSSRHLSCLNSRHLSCLNRRHLACLSSRLLGRPWADFWAVIIPHLSGAIIPHLWDDGANVG